MNYLLSCEIYLAWACWKYLQIEKAYIYTSTVDIDERGY